MTYHFSIKSDTETDMEDSECGDAFQKVRDFVLVEKYISGMNSFSMHSTSMRNVAMGARKFKSQIW